MSDEQVKPEWKRWSDDPLSETENLDHECVARFVGEIGLKALQSDNADPNEWPTADSTWDDLANSSKWSCVRAGMNRVAQLNERVGELEGLLTEAIPFIGWTSKPDGLVERCEKAVGYGEEQP